MFFSATPANTFAASSQRSVTFSKVSLGFFPLDDVKRIMMRLEKVSPPPA
jgi:hypothetical protein